MDDPRPWRRRLIVGLAAVALVVAGGILFAAYTLRTRRAEANAARRAFVERLVEVQQRFRAEDLDGDGVADFASKAELLRLGLIEEAAVPGFYGLWDVVPSSTAPTERWYALASAFHPGQGDAFFVNHAGVIYTRSSQSIPAIDPDTCAPSSDMKPVR